MVTKNALHLALFVLFGIGLASSVRAYTFTERVWRVMPVRYAIDMNEVGSAQGGPGMAVAKAALESAVASWNGTGSGFTAEVGPDLSSHEEGNLVNEVVWLRTWDPGLGDIDSVLAVARTWAGGIGPEFTASETDIFFNGDRFDWSSGSPVRRGGTQSNSSTVHVMTHEVGHSVGMGHSAEPDAVMYFQANDASGTLSDDDTQGALALYPPGGPLCTDTAQCPVQPGTGSICSPEGLCGIVPAGELGSTCGGAAPCSGGLTCYDFAGGSVCSKNCVTQADCGDSLFCITATSGNVCFPPGPKAAGEACTFRSECQSTLCLGDLCRVACVDDDCQCPLDQICNSIMSNTLTLNYCREGLSECVRCGDGRIGGDETCDDGAGNSDAIADTCRTTCQEAGCGDGLIDTDEECDDSNVESNDGCSDLCVAEEIDAGIVDSTGDAGGILGETEDVEGGCGCQAGSDGPPPLGYAFLLFGLAWSFRRRCQCPPSR